MKIYLNPGESITIGFRETDGDIEVCYDHDALRVKADMPDDQSRDEVIYEASFVQFESKPFVEGGQAARVRDITLRGLPDMSVVVEGRPVPEGFYAADGKLFVMTEGEPVYVTEGELHPIGPIDDDPIIAQTEDESLCRGRDP